MANFNSILKSKTSKKRYTSNVEKIYKENLFLENVNYELLEKLNVEDLLEANKKKKFNIDLITLWGKLEMKSYLDYVLGNTPNLYFVNCSKHVPVKKLSNYDFMEEDARRLNLLDIKLIKPFTFQGISFDTTYLATFEILDQNSEYRPYVLLFHKNKENQLVNYAFGYDSNDNGNVELFMPSFNYPVYLNSKGILSSPLSNQTTRLNVYDYITDEDIQNILKRKKS